MTLPAVLSEYVIPVSLLLALLYALTNHSRYNELIAIRANVVGFDFVEVNPQLDVGTGVTSYLGAHTVLEFLGHICDQRRWVARRRKR